MVNQHIQVIWVTFSPGDMGQTDFKKPIDDRFVKVKSAAYKEKSANNLVGTIAISWWLDKLNIISTSVWLCLMLQLYR